MTDGRLHLEALFTLSYGLHIVTSHSGERLNGQISNTVMQVTDSPPRLAAAVNKKALTHEFISGSGSFAVSVLAESAPMKLIGLFGFKSGRDTDKLSQVSYETGSTGCPIVRDHALAAMEVRVEATLDCGTHTVFVGEVVAARILGQGRPMTYAYYREVLGGKTPPTAPTYRASDAAADDDRCSGEALPRQAIRRTADAPLLPQLHPRLRPRRTAKNQKESPKMKKNECDVCGYVYDPEQGDPDNDVAPGTAFDDLPDAWVCPTCGAAKDQFSPAD